MNAKIRKYDGEIDFIKKGVKARPISAGPNDVNMIILRGSRLPTIAGRRNALRPPTTST